MVREPHHERIVRLTQKLPRVALAAEVFFHFFEQQQSRAVEGEEVNMPRNRGEVVNVSERRVEEEAAKQKRRRTRRDRVVPRSPAQNLEQAVAAE